MGKLADYLYADEAHMVNMLLDQIDWSDERSQAVKSRAVKLVEDVRGQKRKTGELEVFMRQYSLSTKEGLALMSLAEALLRIPDKQKANDLIKDKVAANDWLGNIGHTKDWMVKAAGVGLMLSEKTLESVVARLGQPVIREAMVQAMKIMGSQFVLGRTIEEATKRAKDYPKYRMSYDMLGEGARTAGDAQRYFEAYKSAIDYIGSHYDKKSGGRVPGISVKLSALHPRYQYAQAAQCLPVLIQRLKDLCVMAKGYNMALTVDAEESERLEISLFIIDAILQDPALDGWDGFGMAVQAYQKRCYALIDRIAGMASHYGRRMQIRLVKGAYWDREIKYSQVEGFQGYPVYTRKVNTDLSYLACAQKLLSYGEVFFPMFATHNAHTIAAILEMSASSYQGVDFEFQKLHGMGDGLYDIVLQDNNVQATVYAPVGPHSDLLAYLVRRLLENGANSSFVNKIMDNDLSPETIVADPVENARAHNSKMHGGIPLPRDLFGDRLNSSGLDLNDDDTVRALMDRIRTYRKKVYRVQSLVADSRAMGIGGRYAVISPADHTHTLGDTEYLSPDRMDYVFKSAQNGFDTWSKTPAEQRARALEAYADLMEKHHAELMALCVYEAGKTIRDAHLELREAVDFCRYYAQQGRVAFHPDGHKMPGPTGESNILTHHGRGIFVCISPWNFPLAIFTGQVAAALMAGNAVIAKPAEQTCIIAHRAVQLMLEAGIPKEALQLVMGGGQIGAQLVEHSKVGGVAFTGSTEVAKIIQRTLAAKDGAIVPLIAETGGQNAMIVDSSALPEQVIDSVVLSAFGSAGQRCSALRVLYLQEDVADKMLEMLKGAMAELIVGHPEDLASDVGPVIDPEALGILSNHRAALENFAKRIAIAPHAQLANSGYYFSPCAYEISNISHLQREIFGPVLHVIRYKASEIDDVIASINATGYGLTLGVHSRIEAFQKKILEGVRAGNAYVNRGMTGAVVGSQPFGGRGLSGTGPKAGGPHYLYAFSTEKATSIDTTATGGNASLVSLGE